MTQKEWNEIHKDIQGSSTSSNSGSYSSLPLQVEAEEEEEQDSRERIKLGCQLVHKGIEKPLQKATYRDACDKVPELVQKESNPLPFLQGEKVTASVRPVVLLVSIVEHRVEQTKTRQKIFCDSRSTLGHSFYSFGWRTQELFLNGW